MQSLDLDRLNETVLLQRERFAAAAPFPHIALDGLLYPDVADAVVREFDAARDGWQFSSTSTGPVAARRVFLHEALHPAQRRHGEQDPKTPVSPPSGGCPSRPFGRPREPLVRAALRSRRDSR